MSSINLVLHTTTWDYFTSESRLPIRFSRSPKVVKEVIMTDINDLVQEFWRISSDGAVEASFSAMHRLFGILQECFDILDVCCDIISVFATAVDLTDKNLQVPTSPNFSKWHYSAVKWDLDDPVRAKFKISFDGYRKMFYQSLSKSEELGDILKFLPGIVVQKHISMQGMADLYRIKPDLLERLIKSKSTIQLLKPSSCSRYILDENLSGFLRDRDRSQLCGCDPMLQHISICRHFLSLLDGSNTFDLQS